MDCYVFFLKCRELSWPSVGVVKVGSWYFPKKKYAPHDFQWLLPFHPSSQSEAGRIHQGLKNLHQNTGKPGEISTKKTLGAPGVIGPKKSPVLINGRWTGKCDSPRLLVKGDPAAGKTTFAKQLLTWIM